MFIYYIRRHFWLLKWKGLSKKNFDFLYVIGKGGFSKVWKVLHKKSKLYFALKEMSKAKFGNWKGF